MWCKVIFWAFVLKQTPFFLVFSPHHLCPRFFVLNCWRVSAQICKTCGFKRFHKIHGGQRQLCQSVCVRVMWVGKRVFREPVWLWQARHRHINIINTHLPKRNEPNLHKHARPANLNVVWMTKSPMRNRIQQQHKCFPWARSKPCKINLY